MTIPEPRCSQAIALALLSALGWLGGCSDNPGGLNSKLQPPPEDLVVSNPALIAGVTARAGSALARPAGATDSGGTVAYISLAPGTVPAGRSATVRRVGDVASVTTAVPDGGFDPVPLGARAGDSVDVQVTDANARTVFQRRVAVPVALAPIVVRTYPPPRKRDQPLNASIVIVFSEPVDGATVSAGSIRLLRGQTAVGGTVRFLDPSLDATHLSVEFAPDAPLGAATDYLLVVTQQLRDLSGDLLAAPDTVTFTTGQSTIGPPDSIRIAPDSQVVLVVGATYPLTATVRDRARNLLTNQPVTWSSSDPTILTVSPAGLVTAQGDGFALVSASVGGVSTGVGVFVKAQPPVSLSISPTLATVAAGDTLFLLATARDADGRTINNPSLTWTSSDPAGATAAPAGPQQPRYAIVTGVTQANVTISATSGSARGTAAVTVGPPLAVGTVTIAPDRDTLPLQATLQLTATLRSASGRGISGRAITWRTSDPAVATVDANGLVTAAGVGSAGVTATSEGVDGSATITVIALQWLSVSANTGFTCGVTSSGAAYCWGDNSAGQLGIGTQHSPDSCSAIGSYGCSTVPVAVIGGLSFTSVTGWEQHACGLSTTGAAYCWGENASGELGIPGGGMAPSEPVTGHTFSSLSAGENFTCGVESNGAAYCWGWNGFGQLGTGGPADGSRWVNPRPVAGGLTFTMAAGKDNNACGLTTSGAAYCWGDNTAGQLGIGTTDGPEHCSPYGDPCSTVPVAVSGGLTFSFLSVGGRHACGLTTTGAAYCWGFNSVGQLGDGSNNSSSVPVPVTGGLSLSTVSAGGTRTCGVTTSGSAYCWGAGSAAPVVVTGGLVFRTVSVGREHVCGVTTSQVAFCWGSNFYGQLGNGSQIDSSMPVKVAGQR